MSAEKSPNCYKCCYRDGVPGSAHSHCGHPAAAKDNPLAEMMAIFAGVGRVAPVIDSEAAAKINVTGKQHGIRSGWFNWPYNFDPIWLHSCDGFSPKVAQED